MNDIPAFRPNPSEFIYPADSRTYFEQETIDLSETLRSLWWRKWTIFFWAFVGLMAGAAILAFVVTPKYVSTARLIIERPNEDIQLSRIFSGEAASSTAINTEIEVLRSHPVLQRLVQEMSLHKDAEFNANLGPRGFIDKVLRLPVNFAQENESQFVPSALKRAIEIEAKQGTNLIDVRVTTLSPRKSAMIANQLLNIYLENQVEAKFAATQFSVVWLSERVAKLEQELEATDKAIKALKSQSLHVDQDGLNALNLRARTLRNRLQNADRFLLEQVSREPADTNSLNDIQKRALVQKSALKDALFEIEQQIERQSTVLAELEVLQQERNATQVLYETFLSQLKETSLRSGSNQANGRILAQALPGSLVSPNKVWFLAVSTLLGALFGVVVVLCRQYFYSGLRSIADLQSIGMAPVLGEVPKMPITKKTSLIGFLATNTNTQEIEAVRNLRTSILLAGQTPPKSIAITSSFPEEGKTTLSIALARNLATMGRKVLLIEGDLRRPTFASHFGAGSRYGLSDVSNGNAQLQSAVQTSHRLGFDYLCAGQLQGNAADLFASPAVHKILKEAQIGYDHVLLDLPPVLMVPDARLVAAEMDTLLFCVRWNKTTKAQVEDGVKMFTSIGVPVTGMVLNGVDRQKMRRFGAYRRYSAYQNYGYGQA